MATFRWFSQAVLRPSFNQTRQFSAVAHGEQHQSGRTRKILTFMVVLPSVGVCMLNAFLKAQHHSHDQPEFILYPHLRIRNKCFPWGDGSKTLFHNSHVNALPNGYESSHHRMSSGE